MFHTPGRDGLNPNLGKKLIYRTLLEAQEVYSEGVPEWEALDKLPVYATELQWSLIYRKLKGKRGCTPLLPWEAQRLIDMIRNKNFGRPIANAQFLGGFDWDSTGRKIVVTPSRRAYPFQRDFNFNVLGAICNLQRYGRAYEPLLQLYFTENIGRDVDLNPMVGDNPVWFGNEVACGVGMQKIDILTICEDMGKRSYRIIELKDEPLDPGIGEQVEYYVNWASQNSGRHLDGAFNWNIQPVIAAPPSKIGHWQSTVNALKEYNRKQILLPILYFQFKVRCGQDIVFEQVQY